MINLFKLFGFVLLLSHTFNATAQQHEYNVWYEKDAVLYNVTQKADGSPVMVSISQPGFKTANLTISYLSSGKCPAEPIQLEADRRQIPSRYVCSQQGADKIEHFLVGDAGCVNSLVKKLNTNAYILLQKDIKVLASNIRTPRYGMGSPF